MKWINPDITKGEQHDIAVNIGEGGGIWALDRDNGKFLWATPFPVQRSELHSFEHRCEDREGVHQRRPDRR